MPESTIQTPGNFTEGIPYVVQFRVVDKNQAVQTSGTLSGNYTLNVYDVSTRGAPTLVHTETQAASNVTFQTVNNNNGWDKDDTGWNVQLAVDPGNWSTTNAVGGKTYKFELTVTVSATSDDIALDWRQVCVGRAGT